MPITPGMPALAREHVRRRLGPAGGRADLRDLGLGREQDLRLDVAALGVDRVELGGDRAGPRDVGREQQLQPRVGAVQPPGGVDPRGEAEADRARVDAARVDARHVHQRLQPGLARRGQRPQPGPHEPPVLPHERHAVGHRGERDEVEVRVGGARIQARGLEQRPREQVRDAGRAQLRARVAADARVHDRRVGQPPVGARRVVVGDHDVHPGRPRGGDLLDRGDRAVDRHQQLGPARGEPLDGREREPVPVVDPARQVPVDLRAERPQRAHEHRRGADPVDVVVPVDGDPRAAHDVPVDDRGALAQPAEGVERVRHAGLEELARGGALAEPAAHEHLRGDVRDAELRPQPLGGGVVVGRDRQADVGRSHGARRYAAPRTETRFSAGSCALPSRTRRHPAQTRAEAQASSGSLPCDTP